LADGACSAKELEKIATCTNDPGLVAPTGAGADFCPYYKKMYACYTKCYCDTSADTKKQMDEAVAMMKEAYQCTDIEACVSAAAGLRASAFAVFVAAAATLVAAR
jgi:hypothetical protein